MIVGAVYRRAIGGGFSIRRSVLNVAYAGFGFALGAVLGGDLVVACLVAVTLVGAHTGPLHGETMARGRPNHFRWNWYTQAWFMSVRFCLWLLPLAWWLGVPEYAALGVVVSAGYDLAYLHFDRGLLDHPTEWGEWWTGAVFEGCVILSLLMA